MELEEMAEQSIPAVEAANARAKEEHESGKTESVGAGIKSRYGSNEE